MHDVEVGKYGHQLYVYAHAFYRFNFLDLKQNLWFFSRYPNPSAFNYERRFFCLFEYALQPPPWYKPEQIAVNKPELPFGLLELKRYDGPQAFIIPGNHGQF